MRIYLLDDDENIIFILKKIMQERKLGEICGSENDPAEALEDLRRCKPDIVIVDLLMPAMDGTAFLEQAHGICPEASYVMLSQVSDKKMIAATYEAGAEFYIQKPVNAVEVESVLKRVTESRNMRRTIENMHRALGFDPTGNDTKEPKAVKPSSENREKARKILRRLGILGDIGSRDILVILDYMTAHQVYVGDMTIAELCEKVSDTPKSSEQRIRRTIQKGLSNLASLGIEDYGNETFQEFSSTLYDFSEIRMEMNYIQGKNSQHGKAKVKKFLNTLASYIVH